MAVPFTSLRNLGEWLNERDYNSNDRGLQIAYPIPILNSPPLTFSDLLANRGLIGSLLVHGITSVS
jgi:hypothetical protein|tara:strand:- start:1290 stop:1487 length:198 start_codon:yes stop_codon:yes gene_type:complete